MGNKWVINVLLVMIMILGLIGCQGKDQQKKIEITADIYYNHCRGSSGCINNIHGRTSKKGNNKSRQ